MLRPWLTALTLLTASSAAASGAAHTHDGFFLRLQGGGGWMRASQDDLALKGGAGGLNVEIGGALTRDFILYGKLYGVAAPNPDLEVGDITFENNGNDVSLNLGALGVGATYYFMPVNLYVSGAVSLTSLSLTQDGDELGDTGSGVGLHLGVGKEWWVSDQWGLGVGAEFALTRLDGGDNAGNWGAGSILVLFSATFN